MKWLTVALAIILAISCEMPEASADGDGPSPSTESGTSGADDNGFWIRRSGGAKDSAPSLTEGSSRGSVNHAEVAAGTAGCWGANQVSGEIVQFTFCSDEPEPTTPVLTVGLIRTAFAELKLPAGTLVIQPPDGLTLVNFDTNFYTTSTDPIARTVTLLGRRVTLEATPSTFHWTFGDGESLTTSDPGAPYPRLRVTHNYLRKDTYRPSLATTYTGRYRVGDGPWRQIPGTVTITGTGQALRAIEAQPKLVSY